MNLPAIGLCLLCLLGTGRDEVPPAPSGAQASVLLGFLPDEVGGWKVFRHDRYYSRKTIRAYLGREAERFLGFGFSGLFVRRYSDGTRAPISAEIFDMSKAADAYGVFSADQEGDPAAVGPESLYLEGSLRFWKGPYYVRLKTAASSPEIRSLLVGLGLRIAARMPGEGARPRLVSCLPLQGLERGSVRFFHRQDSLNAYYYLADENVLLLDDTTEVALGRFRTGRSVALGLICRYPGTAVAGRDYFSAGLEPDARSAVEEVEEGDWAAARRIGDCLVLVLEASDRAHCEALLEGLSSGVAAVFGRRSSGDGGGPAPAG